jgi:hypothetical protein
MLSVAKDYERMAEIAEMRIGEKRTSRSGGGYSSPSVLVTAQFAPDEPPHIFFGP